MAANSKKTSGRKTTFMWTNDMAELLLRVTLDYKTKKLQENEDWETCLSKYADIMENFVAQYPRQPARNKNRFPYDVSAITKLQLTAKLKAIRSKYRAAVDTGKRSGQGRVVYDLYELCREIWGGSPATSGLGVGFESGAKLEASPATSTSSSPIEPVSPHSQDESSESKPAVNNLRDFLQSSPTGHRTNRRKRRLPPAEHFVLEDLKVKQRMLEVMEESSRRMEERMEESARHSAECLASITSSIQETLSLMRQFMPGPYPTIPHRHSSAFMAGDPHPSRSHTARDISVKQEEPEHPHTSNIIQERSPSLLQEEPEPPHINEEQEELLERPDGPMLTLLAVKQEEEDCDKGIVSHRSEVEVELESDTDVTEDGGDWEKTSGGVMSQSSHTPVFSCS